MLKSQKLELRASEIRARLNEIGGLEGDALTDEVKAERDGLVTEFGEVEAQKRAAIIAEDVTVEPGEPTDPEARERLALRGRARLGGFLAAALAGRSPDGAEAEFAAACGVPGIPLDLFEADRPRPKVEKFADAATGAPSSGTGATLAPIQPFVFADSIAPRLGIAMPTVGSGAYSEATISTALTAGATTKGSKRESTAATLTPATANARRISARLSVTLEDVATVGQANFEAALRENARAALANAYDDQCINGNGTAPNITGLVKALETIANPTDPTAIATFDAFLQAFSDQIDGLWASMLSEVAIVANVDAYKLSARTFRDHTIDETAKAAAARGSVSFADYAREKTGGWWTNKRMPATASHIARGIVHRRGRPGMRTAVHPVWANVAIDDVYSDSGSGMRHFSLHVLVGDKVLLVQPDAYALAEFKVSS